MATLESLTDWGYRQIERENLATMTLQPNHVQNKATWRHR